METFISDISQKSFPSSERVSGQSIRKSMLTVIQHKYPDFGITSSMALSELNQFRQEYISGYLANETGKLTELESTVVKLLTDHQTISDKMDEEQEERTFGQRMADKLASFGGSWGFIIFFLSFITIWIIINVVFLLSKAFDPYPFILLNLILSCIAALQAPVIMMSQNRQEEKDRIRAKKDYMINLKSELEIRMLHEKMDHLIIHQQQRLLEIQQIQIDMMQEIMQRVNGAK
jgi:uncharacterized membrane protein